MGEKTRRLLRRVGMRQRLAALGSRWYVFLLWAAAAWGLVLVGSRLLGVLPNVQSLAHLGIVPAAALVVAALFHRRPPSEETARLVDVRAKTDDLFLTACLIEDSRGRYGPLVLRQAERTAGQVEPRRVMPLRWWPKARNGALVVAALGAAFLWLPQLDPFGRQRQRRQRAERREDLRKSRKATRMRMAALEETLRDAELSKDVEQALEELKRSLDASRPEAKEQNLAGLKRRRGELSEMWRKVGKQNLKALSAESFSPQNFGREAARKAERWKKDLQKGRTDGLKKEISELKKKLDRLSKLPEGAEKRKLREEIEQSMQQMEEFAADSIGSQALSSALRRALDQLAMSGVESLSGRGLEALSESLELSRMELEALAQDLRDLQALEQAMEAAQLARQLSQMGELCGEECQGLGSLEEYVALYRQRLAQCRGSGTGLRPGTAATGLRKGESSPEDAEVEKEVRPERSRSELRAGRMLLSIKSKGTGRAGQRVRDYRESLREVKQGASEAIVREEIPPQYHDSVRQYFDNLGEGSGASGEE